MNLFSIQQFLQICIQNGAKWADDGWGGYIEPGAISTLSSGLVLMTPKLNLTQAQASMKPMTDFAQNLLNLNIGINAEVSTTNSYYEAYQKFLEPNEELVGLGTAIGSRLIPRANFIGSTNQNALLNALLDVSKTVTFPFQLNPSLLGYGAPLQVGFDLCCLVHCR